jgi:hypothetical protein
MAHIFTLQQIRDKRPCIRGWEKLLASTSGLNDLSIQVSLGDVARSNGVKDALWVAAELADRRVLVSMIMPSVKRASRHTQDKRVHDCIAAIEGWLAGDDSIDLEAVAESSYAAHAYAAHAYAADAAANAANTAHASTAHAAVYFAANAYASSYAAYSVVYAVDVVDVAHAIAYATAEERARQMADILVFSPLHFFKDT